MRHPILLLCCLVILVLQWMNSHAQETAQSESQTEQPVETATDSPAEPASLTRTERQEEALRRRLPPAELRQLESADEAFLGLFLAAARPEPRGGVVLIANRGEHPDWPELIGPARRQLSSQGWHTLAISLPEAPPEDPAMEEAERTEALAERAERTTRRINIAAQALQAEGAGTLVLLGRGEGAFWALHASAADTRPQVKAAALILVEAQPPPRTEGGNARLNALLAQWQKPVYEIFDGTEAASRERAREHKLSAQRHAARHYQQLLILKADPSELGQRMLVKRLEGWLDRTLANDRQSASQPEAGL